MSLPAEGTVLILDGMGIPLYSLRGAKQTLTPIAGPAPRRTINQVLYDVSVPGQRKYASEITCTDQRVLDVDEWSADVTKKLSLEEVGDDDGSGPGGTSA